MAASNKFTKDHILALLNGNPDAVKRAILALHERQTEDERSSGSAKRRNSAGFSQTTAPDGTRLAMMILARQPLDSAAFQRALQIARFHAGQLARIANELEAQRGAQRDASAHEEDLRAKRRMYDGIVRDIEQLLGRPVDRNRFNETVKRRAAVLGDKSPEGMIGAAQEILEDMQARQK